jgi:catechol 2,3-dioxygenase-like lactoylglutathione lyase family enzyme
MKTAHLILAAMTLVLLAGCASLRLPFLTSSRVVATTGPGIDHVPIWTRDRDATVSLLTDRLGFTIDGPERYADGIETQTITLANATYLELFSVYDEAVARTQAPTEMEFLRLSFGPTNFGLRTRNVAVTRAELNRLGLTATLDPRLDGEAWTTVTPQQGLIPGEPFFIHYDTSRGPAPYAHRNTARGITAVWIVSEDASAAGAIYRGFGLRVSAMEPMPRLGGNGLRVKVGNSWILIVEPTGPGLAQTALDRPGHRLFGLSLEVADLDVASKVLTRGLSTAPQAYDGPFGRSIRADTATALGITLEFHAPR